MSAQVHLAVSGYCDSDDEERAELTRALRSELLQAGADDVSHPGAPAPEGAMGSALEWSQLVVTFGGTLPALIVALRAWLGRRSPGVTIGVKIGADEITIAEPTDEERAKLLEAWLRRHEHE